MDSGKTLTIDGLPAEFYRTFWNDLVPSLITSLNYAYKAGTLSCLPETRSDQTNTKKGH